MKKPVPVIPPLNIILIGLMGCGKTTIGKELQRETKRAFSDTDQMIEEMTQLSIPQIFAQHGEAHFRNLETDLLRKMSKQNTTGRIISTGGGIILRSENRTLLKNLGYVVWLRTDPETLYRRISRSTNRPLLQTESPQKVLRDLTEQRKDFYKETAHLVIDTADLNVHEIAFGILESVKVFQIKYLSALRPF